MAPVLADGYLYAMTSFVLSKYDAATGKLIWRINPDPSYTTYYVSLAVSRNLIIVGGVDCTSVSTPGGRIQAFNATTGAHVWSGSLDNGLEGAVVSGGYVIAAGTNVYGSGVTVFHLGTGKTAWSSLGCRFLGAFPLVVGGLVMSYGCDSQDNEIIEASNLATGAIVWTSSAGDWNLQAGDLDTPAGQHLYAIDPAGAVVDLNPQTGQLEYTLKSAAYVLAVARYRVYASCGYKGQDVCAYDTATGALKWHDTSYPPVLVAAEADRVLYLDSGYVINAETGKYITRIWRPADPALFATAIAVGDGRIAAVNGPRPKYTGESRLLNLYGLPGY